MANEINIGVILASGKGERFGSSVPKQFVKLNGKPVFLYSYEEMEKSDLFDKIIIVIPSKKYSYLIPSKAKWIIGGSTRNDSAYNALIEAKKYNPKNILFHEGARPLIKAEDFRLYFETLKNYPAVTTSTPVTDSLYPVFNRENYKLTTAPEAFNYKFLMTYFNKNRNDLVALYQHLPFNQLGFVTLNHPNYKITYPYDIFMLEHLIKYNTLKLQKPNLQNKRVILFGATGGIGKEVYKLLNKEKAIITSYSSQTLNFLIDELSYFKNADVIINCSGISYTDKEGILEKYDDIMTINLKANLEIIEATKKANNRPINIVLISSSSATKGRENLTVYSASKVALHSIIESQAGILAKQGIYLNCICPEKVDTSLSKKLHGKCVKSELLTTQEVANAILSHCDTKNYGQIIHLRKGIKIC